MPFEPVPSPWVFLGGAIGHELGASPLFHTRSDGNPSRSSRGGLAGSLTVTPDSRRVAYVARRGGKWLVVVDGVEGKEYDAIGAPLFSPDGQRVAYSLAGARGARHYRVTGVRCEIGLLSETGHSFPTAVKHMYQCCYGA